MYDILESEAGVGSIVSVIEQACIYCEGPHLMVSLGVLPWLPALICFCPILLPLHWRGICHCYTQRLFCLPPVLLKTPTPRVQSEHTGNLPSCLSGPTRFEEKKRHFDVPRKSWKMGDVIATRDGNHLKQRNTPKQLLSGFFLSLQTTLNFKVNQSWTFSEKYLLKALFCTVAFNGNKQLYVSVWGEMNTRITVYAWKKNRPNDNLYKQFCKQRNETQRSIKRAKSEYFTSKIAESKND